MLLSRVNQRRGDDVQALVVESVSTHSQPLHFVISKTILEYKRGTKYLEGLFYYEVKCSGVKFTVIVIVQKETFVVL